MSENHYELIGRITVTWNQIEWYWEAIFAALHGGRQTESEAIFLCAQNAGLMRQMCHSLANLKLRSDGAAYKRFKDFYKATNDESAKRNVVSHARYSGANDDETLVVTAPHRLPRVKHDLTDKDLTVELNKILADLKNLSEDAWPVVCSIWHELGEPPL